MKNAVTKTNKKINPEFIGILKHQSIIFLIFTVIITACCILLFFINANQQFMRCFSAISISLASFINGYISGRKYRKNGLAVGIINNIPSLLIILIISLILNNFNIDYTVLITIPLNLILSATGGIVAVNTRLRVK